MLASVIALAACGQPSVAGESSALPELGAAVYAAECVACHGGRDGQGALAGAPPHGPGGHTWHHPDAQLQEIILKGGPFEMPGFRDRLSEREVEAVLAYIKTWWTDEQRAVQADISARYAQAAAP